MSDVIQKISDVQQSMRLALSKDDWEALSELDLQCRDLVQQAMDQATGDKLIVRDAIVPLLELYKHAVAACERHRDELAEELQTFNRQRSGAKVYQNCQF
ncbi:flagellar protein FliT [Litoribrevibacter albus]|uniref:Flagellar protein FliT n=1 Tax=Litoribrevibacter albus TaxID=1473156 RepID=A0AA37SCU9_9GAMM|nr:flagellar protein FliT [Litoribrevibacter albus]GLQ32239.1 hypothetical protein GCM10007876_27180 [Litoribrevibacter albus]